MFTISLPARAGLGIALAALAQSAPLLAQETRTLRAADRIPLHSSVEVSALPAARAAGDSEGVQVKVQPRRRPDPEGLQQLKGALLQAPREPFATPDTIADPGPRVGALSSPLSVISSFEGLANLPDNKVTGFSVSPSDANLAVGPSHVFQMVNIVGRITDKSGAAASTFTLRSFFQVDNGFGESDPSVIYDAASNRWFATYAQFSDPKDPKPQSSLILAVSSTGDPRGSFCLFRLGNPSSEVFIQDFPHLGISDDKVIVTYNGFSFVGESFLGAGSYVINKADLVNAGSVGCQSQSVRRVRVPPDVTRYGVQPAHSLSSTGRLYMAMNGNGASGSSTLVLFAVNGEPGVTGVTEDSIVLHINSWHPPPPDGAVQAASAVRLDTGDASVISAVWQRGSLWLGGNEQCVPSGDTMPRSCLRVIQIQTDLLSVPQDITFGSPGQDYYYPALSPDGADNLVVVFNASSATDFAGVRVSGRLATDPPNTLIASTLLRAGGGAQMSGRMGDFYGAAMDPADPGKVWVTAEYIRTTGARDWGTFVAQLSFMAGPPLPTLALALNSHTFTTGDPLQVNLTVGNPGVALSVDVYFGVLLPPTAGPGLGCPMGDAIAFVTAGFSSIVIRCLSASPASFPKLASGASIPGGLPATTLPGFFGFVWPPAPAGPYIVFMAFAIAGSFDDGSVGPSDIVVVASDMLMFSR